MSSERKFIKENIRRQLLKEHLIRETQRAGFGGLDVARTPLGTHITLIAERPGMVIGRRGSTINRLTDEVENVFEFDNPQIEVQEAEVPALNPGIMAQKLAIALERGWHFRRAGHSTVMRIMEAGARGCQVEISGKLTGDRHRTVKFRQGHIKYCGEPRNQWMRVSITTAAKKSGVLGIKVSIMDPDAKLPDEIELLPPEELTEIFEEYGEGAAPEGPYQPPEDLDAEGLDKIVEADAEGSSAEGEVAPTEEAGSEKEEKAEPKRKKKAEEPEKDGEDEPAPKKEEKPKKERAPSKKPAKEGAEADKPAKEAPKADKPAKEAPKAEEPAKEEAETEEPAKEEQKAKEAPSDGPEEDTSGSDEKKGG